MILKFLDREEEIKKVEEKYESNKSEFAVIYGRRRIGKPELIKKVIEGKHFGLIAKKIDEEVKEKLRSEGYLVFDIAGIKNHEISRD